MKAVIFTHPGELVCTEHPLPEPGSGEVRLRVDAAGICTTDVHIFHGHFAIRPPRVLGHEIVGTVVALGADVSGEWLGRRVGVQPARFCGTCSACRRGALELCENFQCLGNTQDGGYAEYTTAAADQLVPLGNIAADTGVWLEPLACVLHALNGVSLQQHPVLIAGAGTFGNLFTQVLTRIYHIPVGVVDPNPARLDKALAMGASRVWHVPREGATPDTDTRIAAWSDSGPALLIDTSGQATAIERLLRWAGPRATLLLFGVSAPDVQVRVTPAALFARELHLTASAGMTPQAFEAAFQMLPKLTLEPLISARVGLDAVPELFQKMPVGKVIITPEG